MHKDHDRANEFAKAEEYSLQSCATPRRYGGQSANKLGYFDKLKNLLETYKSIFIVSVDNVSSQQMHEIRISLRGEGVVLMGKNTMVRPAIRLLDIADGVGQVRRAIKGFIADMPEYERLLPYVKGNVGFVFTNGDLKETRTKILSNRVAAPARAGAVAPADVYVPAGNTGMEPGKTSFFQALGVPTKIARGTIEITSDVRVCEAGNKIYDQGQVFDTSVLDIEESQLLKAFTSAINTIATISLAVNYPTLPSIMHSLVNSYKNALAVAIETDFSWPEIEELKDRIANPDAYAAAAPAAGAAAVAEDAPAAAKEEEKPAAEDEVSLSCLPLASRVLTRLHSSDEEMGFGLFGDD
ncbi:hypothetical protein MRB53_036890 [Persea americana]|nr:hypothetical protein MRB53_036890 [Persea americana]